MQEQELRDHYAQFRDQNVQAFAGRHFEIAYHALAAATHCAEDAVLLAEIQRHAEEQGQWIDTNMPEHKLSSQHAQVRGNETIFHSLSKQVHSMLLGLRGLVSAPLSECQNSSAKWLDSVRKADRITEIAALEGRCDLAQVEEH